MARWLKKVQIRDLLTEGQDAETIKTAADGIIARLPSEAPTSRLTKAKNIADQDPETALLVFNDGMNRIYDWADERRVWLS